jgi:predicted aspartyl protease
MRNYAGFIIAGIVMQFSSFIVSSQLLTSKIPIDTIPFEFVRGKIIITVVVEGKQRRFGLDTGASFCISNEVRQELKSDSLTTVKNIDIITNKEYEVTAVNVPSFLIGKTTFYNRVAEVFNFSSIPNIRCFKIDGILGSDIFLENVLTIDYLKRQILLSKNQSTALSEATLNLPLTIRDNYHPYIDLNIDGVSTSFLFDTGAEDLIEFSDSCFERLMEIGILKLASISVGNSGSSLSGESYQTQIEKLQIDSLKIGLYNIDDVTGIHMEKQLVNLLGSDLLQRGKITVDYVNRMFSFTPYIGKNQDFIDLDYAGFSIVPLNDYYVVDHVWSKSKAEKAGLTKGLIVTKINELILKKRDEQLDCYLFMARPWNKGQTQLSCLDSLGQHRNFIIE